MHVDPCPTAGFSFFSSPTPRTQHLSSLHGTIRVSEGRLALRLGWGSDRRLSYPGWGARDGPWSYTASLQLERFSGIGVRS